MQRLTGLDATFLYLETPTSHMHVAMSCTRLSAPGSWREERFMRAGSREPEKET